MQRYNLNLKGGTYTQGNTYTALPIYRQQVVPGQTVNIQADVNLKTAAYANNLTTPAMMSVWFFYVPHRLSWDGWTSFISKEENAPAFPEFGDPAWAVAPFFFEGNADSLAANFQGNPFYRRAYKLCYNEYFGTPDFGGTYYYDDYTDDSVITPYSTRNPEQFASRLKVDDTSIVMTSGRRPNDYSPIYGDPTNEDWLDSFYSADNLQTKDVYSRYLSNAVIPNQTFTERFGYLKNGEWLLGNGTTRWTADNQVINFKDAIYPNPGLLQFSEELGGGQVAITSSVKLSGKIPVGKSVA